MEARSDTFWAFDLDGTLTKGTEHSYADARREGFLQKGLIITPELEAYSRLRNMFVADYVNVLCPDMPMEEQEDLVAELYAIIEPMYNDVLFQQVQLREGAIAVLRALKDPIIVTSANPGNVAVHIRKFPALAPYLHDVVTSHDTGREGKKPRPKGLSLAEQRRGNRRMFAYVGNEGTDTQAAYNHRKQGGQAFGILLQTSHTKSKDRGYECVAIDHLEELIPPVSKRIQDLLSRNNIAG